MEILECGNSATGILVLVHLCYLFLFKATLLPDISLGPMEISIKFDAVESRWSIACNEGLEGLP